MLLQSITPGTSLTPGATKPIALILEPYLLEKKVLLELLWSITVPKECLIRLSLERDTWFLLRNLLMFKLPTKLEVNRAKESCLWSQKMQSFSLSKNFRSNFPAELRSIIETESIQNHMP